MVTLTPLSVCLGVLVAHCRIIVLLLTPSELGQDWAGLGRLESGVLKRWVLCGRLAVGVGRDLDRLLSLVVFWVWLVLLEGLLNGNTLEARLALSLLTFDLLVLSEVLEVLRVRVRVVGLCLGCRVELLYGRTWM